MMNNTQFDLEQNIMECWGITEQINTLYEAVLDSPKKKLTEDDIANILLGIKQLYDLKFEKTFHVFEQFVKEVHKKG